MYSLLINHLLARCNQNDIYTLKFCSFLAIIFDVLSTCYRLNCVLPEVFIHSTCECDLIFEQDLCRVSPNSIWLVSFIKMEHFEHRHKWKTMWGYWENILYKSRNSYSCALQVESFTSLATREVQVVEWVAFPFSSGSSWPRNQIRVSCIASRFLMNWAIRKAPCNYQRLEKAWCRILSNSSQEEPILPTLLFKTSKSSLKNC